MRRTILWSMSLILALSGPGVAARVRKAPVWISTPWTANINQLPGEAQIGRSVCSGVATNIRVKWDGSTISYAQFQENYKGAYEWHTLGTLDKKTMRTPVDGDSVQFVGLMNVNRLSVQWRYKANQVTYHDVLTIEQPYYC